MLSVILFTTSKLELRATLGKTTKLISTIGNEFMDATSWCFACVHDFIVARRHLTIKSNPHTNPTIIISKDKN
jgi:hypothetical protein